MATTQSIALPLDFQISFDAPTDSFSADLMHQFDTRTSIIRNQVFTLADIPVLQPEEDRQIELPRVEEKEKEEEEEIKEPTVLKLKESIVVFEDPLADFLSGPDEPIRLFEPIQLITTPCPLENKHTRLTVHPTPVEEKHIIPQEIFSANDSNTSSDTNDHEEIFHMAVQEAPLTMLRKSSNFFRQKIQQIKSKDDSSLRSRRASLVPPLSSSSGVSQAESGSDLSSSPTVKSSPQISTQRSTLSSKRRSMFCLFLLK
ncbi:hypothetical protein PHYBLDRAFT_169494 [Phycomyces blakesleeanus NRRL 1555(-)]|uniref:Uncharacterized protein n=2 Tax=Phycomyces blakesleeanus TaxID=4837 RepID=A0A162PRZ4_PHYB8|nr:hypothetical protein PHYBLDRAFT_169494 [Phycomyces blakesleeanus NRRL 1555(-)]OAD72356.1 hypothetical protein PHYBLDRAFT_169494 [Phycomyces blakesleeanus NRRL 1555(-)]|eukprot:XP_018290396.1 hypothetical protein PHYBLDRAFT_169494 [Phycomyces blakesleeanus NRRL 1555(-)]